MFTEAFPQFENTKVVRALRTYFGSVWHAFVVVLLMTVSALFGLELPVYYCFAVLSVLISFFGRDMLGAVPIVVCAPMTIAAKHSPDRFPEAFFGDPSVLTQIFFCVAVILIVFFGRLISMLIRNPKRKMPRFALGFLFLGVAYLAGGAFSAYYSTDTVWFGFLELLALCFFYFYFYFTIDWKKAPKGYFAYMLAAIGFTLVIQILSMYFREGVVVDGTIENRSRLFLGWAHYNYAAAVTAMCIPAIFYFSFTQKHSWIFTLFATVVMCGVVLAQSRGTILFGGFIYLVCVVITLVKTKKKERIFNLIVLGVVLVTLIVVCVVYLDNLKKLFANIFALGVDDNDRFSVCFTNALNYFRANPAFGAGWGGKNWENGYSFLKFFKAHNTVMQLLGSLGIFGLVAYSFHRVQTCIAAFRHPTKEKTCIALSVAVLLLTCMMDVHIFSIGPTMLYSVLLLFLEGENIRDGVDTRIRLRKRK